MSEEQNTVSAPDQAGSADELIKTPNPVDAVSTGQLETKATVEDMVPKSQYEELERKLGEQGNELGQYREFLSTISPLLDNLKDNGETVKALTENGLAEILESQPELLEGILSGKVDGAMAKAVLEGKVSLESATAVTQAHQEVKQDLGKKEYAQKSPEEIEALVESKLSEKMAAFEKNFQKTSADKEELKEFEEGINTFIESTPDFAEVADRVEVYLQEHPELDDISVAYFAVKGIIAQEKIDEDLKVKAGENAKNVAANAAGGSSQTTVRTSSPEMVDRLIGGVINPNSF